MKEKNPFIEILLVSTVAIVFIALITAYTNGSRKNIDKFASYAVQQNTYRLAKEIELSVQAAIDDIQFVTHLASDVLEEKPETNPDDILKSYSDRTPFSSLEFMPINSSSADEREYYKKGMNGKAGIWIDYNTSSADKHLLNFYAPLYVNSKIIGVGTGIIEVQNILKPLKEKSSPNEDLIGILCDKDGHIIGTSFELKDDLYMKDLMTRYGVPLQGKDAFLNRMDTMDKSFFRYYDSEGIGFGSVHSINSTGWFLVQILPSIYYKETFQRSVMMQFLTIGCIILLFIGYIIYIAISKCKTKKTIEEINKKFTKEKNEEKERYYTIVQESLIKSEKYKNAVLAEALTIFEVNLTQNIMDYGKIRLDGGKAIALEDVLDEKFPCTYDSYVEQWAEKFVKSTSRMDFMANSNRKYLLDCASVGKSEVAFEYPAIGISGRSMYIRRSILLTTDENTGDIIAYGNTKDITAQKEKELLLANYEKLLISTANGIYNGVLQVNLQNFEMVYHRFNNDRIISNEMNSFDMFVKDMLPRVYPEDVERVQEFCNREVLLNLPYGVSQRINYRDIEKNENGTLRVWTMTCSKTLINRKPYALFVKVDTTSSVESETAHRKELEDALKRAENANKAKSLFLSNVSHDIRTPMNAIVGFTDLAEHHIDNKKQVSTYLEKISTASKHLLSLINDVLDMSYIESQKIQLYEQEYNIFEIVEDLKNIVSADIKAKNHTFDVDVNSIQNPNVLCDRLRLDQILLNLLGNAIKFTNEGGKIEFKAFEVHENGTVYYEFHVKDNGIGMSEKFITHIFDPFERERSSTVSGILGTGLGMSITKSLVDMMHGEISVTSKKNLGSEFIVKLPLKAVEHPSEKVKENIVSKENEKKDFDSHGKCILLVEDNDLNREIGSALLTEAGFDVEEAENGLIAVEKLTEKGPGYYTAILMDIQMPIMDGYTASRKIRALEDNELASIPIIAMTANAFDEDKEKALQAGMNAHIAKPVDVKIFYETLRSVIQ